MCVTQGSICLHYTLICALSAASSGYCLNVPPTKVAPKHQLLPLRLSYLFRTRYSLPNNITSQNTFRAHFPPPYIISMSRNSTTPSMGSTSLILVYVPTGIHSDPPHHLHLHQEYVETGTLQTAIASQTS